ncbi:MAG: POTRA domain-containing protein [Syntrophothermus sp.]
MFDLNLKTIVMNTQFLTYLIESSVYLLFFLVVYRFTISKLTHFSWMRGYLLSSLSLSIVLPLVKIPTHWAKSIMGLSVENVPLQINVLNSYLINTSKTAETVQIAPSSNLLIIIITGLSIIYILGAIYKTMLLFRNVNKILNLIKKNGKKKEGSYVLVDTDIELPAFSFFNFIFINKDFKNLTNDDILRIKNHEIIHAKQWHTLDIIFVEFISVIFWFNPLIQYTKIKLQEIHEFIADEETAGQGEMKKNYAQLLFNLATEKKSFNLMTGFSSKQISNRILMVTKERSIRLSKLLFILILPVALVLLISFSYINTSDINKTTTPKVSGVTTDQNKIQRIGNIKWVNNSVVSSEELSKVLGLKKGDEYSSKEIGPLILARKDVVSDYYLNKGYLFSHIDLVSMKGQDMNLTFTVFEGQRGKIGTLKFAIKGKKTVPEAEIAKLITINSGDWFSKAKIIESVQNLSMSGKFIPDSIKPIITPGNKNIGENTVNVDLVFNLTEK